MTTIYIDADACPVRQETLRVAERHRIAVCVVSNDGIRPDPNPLVETVIVPDGPDAADKDLCVMNGFPCVMELGSVSGRFPGAFDGSVFA